MLNRNIPKNILYRNIPKIQRIVSNSSIHTAKNRKGINW